MDLEAGSPVAIKTIDELLSEFGVHFRDDSPLFVTDMDQYAGYHTTILYVGVSGYYRLKIDNGEYAWSGNWLRPTKRQVKIDENLFEI